MIKASAEPLTLMEGDRVAVGPQTPTRSQGAPLPARETTASPAQVAKAYESPKVFEPEIVSSLERVQTGGLEVVSEKIP